MPLPSASKLYFRHPKPETPEQHEANLEQTIQWADRLPFFGTSATYKLGISPSATWNNTQTSFVPGFSTLNATFFDQVTNTAHPHVGAPNGLLLPYQKQEDWTSIRIDLVISYYATSAPVFAVFRLFILPVQAWTTGSGSQWPPSNRPGQIAGLMILRDNLISVTGQNRDVVDTVIVPPHPRGVYAAQFHWYSPNGATVIAMNQNNQHMFTFTEVPPTLPRWEGDLP